MFKRFLLKVWKNRRGAVIMLIALNFFVMVGVTGAAIDTARGMYLRSEMMSALDAAALAGGATVNQATFNATVNKYFNVNFPAGNLGATMQPVQIAVDTYKEHVDLSVNGSLPGSLLQVIGAPASVAQSEVTVERKGLELAMVMDNTGSMGATNIAAMKSAATDMINILYGSNPNVDNLWVSLVPYVSMVNIGTGNTSWTTGVTPANYSPTTWHGCVFARTNEMTDDTPAVGGLWTPFLWPSSTDNPWICSAANTPFTNCRNEMTMARHRSTCGLASGRWSTTGQYNINENQCAGNNGTGPNLGCGPALIPLTASKTAVIAAINQMDFWSRGGTNSGVGLAWGWRTLSPKWRGVWGSPTPANLPLDYNTPMMSKALVIMTDGNNEWYSYDTVPSDNYASNMTIYAGDMTAYSRPENGKLGTTNKTTATNILNTNFSNLCTTMKNQGIIIYTITFNLSDTTVQNLWRSCASNPSFYFNSPDTATLTAAFHAIGDSLSNLRISK